MSIKPDKWIRRMAQEHGMIEPFVERQVREEGENRLISYGVSSYGYDVRCSVTYTMLGWPMRAPIHCTRRWRLAVPLTGSTHRLRLAHQVDQGDG